MPGREPTPAAGAAGSRSVLLIDDDAAVVRTLGRFFEREGWDVQRACSGEDGLGAELAETPARPAQAPPSGGSLAWPRR